MHKILQNHLFCAFVANLKIDAIYALHPESFCNKNFAIRKVFAFCDSALLSLMMFSRTCCRQLSYPYRYCFVLQKWIWWASLLPSSIFLLLHLLLPILDVLHDQLVKHLLVNLVDDNGLQSAKK